MPVMTSFCFTFPSFVTYMISIRTKVYRRVCNHCFWVCTRVNNILDNYYGAAGRCCLFLSKALRLFDGIVELLDHLLVRLVRRQIQPIKARVRSGQPRVFAHLLDAEALWPVGAHQLGEAADRHATRSGDELQQASAFLVVGLADELCFGRERGKCW